MGDSGSPRSLVQWGANTLGRGGENRDLNNCGCCCVLTSCLVLFLPVVRFDSCSLNARISGEMCSLLALKDNPFYSSYDTVSF